MTNSAKQNPARPAFRATVLTLYPLGILLIGQWVLTRQARRSGQRGGGVATIVAENAAG